MAEHESRRITHPLPDPHPWPSEAEARSSRLFSPGRLGPVLTRTRTWVPAMVPWRASEEGEVTPDVLDWYARFAAGRPGVLVVEATGSRDEASGPLLRIGDDRFIPGLRELVRVVAEASAGTTRLLIQVIDFLRIARRPTPERFFQRYLKLSEEHRNRLLGALPKGADLPQEDPLVRDILLKGGPDLWGQVLSPRELEALNYGYRERVGDTELEHIRRLPERLPPLFAAASRRAVAAGFDGVELHFAHAYTLASFLSRRNRRDDGYGGSLEGRVRLPLEVISAVRREIGPGTALGCRFLGEEAIEGGSTIDDACRFAVRFARAGLDFLSVSKGGKFEDAKQPRVGEAAYPYTGPSGHECMPTVHSDARGPFGRNLPLARALRRAVREAGFKTPIVTAGGICHFRQAEKILAAGDADFVAAARQSLADPDWWLKMEMGFGEEIRRCRFTNYCEGLDQRHRQVTCRLWDKQMRPEDELPRSHDGRRRLLAPHWETPRGS